MQGHLHMIQTFLISWTYGECIFFFFIFNLVIAFELDHTLVVVASWALSTVVFIHSPKHYYNLGLFYSRCPSCMIQAETIVDVFGKEGNKFKLFYHPSPPRFLLFTRRRAETPNSFEGKLALWCLTCDKSNNPTTTTIVVMLYLFNLILHLCFLSLVLIMFANNNNNNNKGPYPMYTLDRGFIAQKSYEHLSIGSFFLGFGTLAFNPSYR